MKEIINIDLSGVNSNNFKVSIYNLHGQKLYENSIQNEINSINISFLPKGLYVIKIESEKGIISINKFNKQE